MRKQKEKKITKHVTVGELIDHLKIFHPDSDVIFGSDQLTFYRTKLRGEKLVQIEFDEIIPTIYEE